MQDDDAMDRGISVAMARNEPFYVLYDFVCLHDETGRFPDKPTECYKEILAKRDHGNAERMFAALKRKLGK